MQKPGRFGMSGFLLFLLTCCSFALQAQEGGSLILIDAENRQSFSVRIGDQLFASSVHGHLVLSSLKDSSYRLHLHFPNSSLNEQVFPVVLRKKDLGLQLRGADNSWVLYNWQSKETIHAILEQDSSRILEMGVRKEDGFSKLMAAVVDDTAVMYNTYTGNWLSKDSVNSLAAFKSPDNLMVGTSKSPTIVPILPHSGGRDIQTSKKTWDTAVTRNGQSTVSGLGAPGNPGQNPSPIKNPSDSLLAKNASLPTVPGPRTQSAKVPRIKKLREVNLKISRKLVFLDAGSDGFQDTITLFVFFEKGDSTLKNQSLAEDLARKKTQGSDSTRVSKVLSKNNEAKTFVPGCGEVATEADLQWLRSEVLKANTEQEKITAAVNAFALKCFSVSQVRVLAALLVSDKARYRLMDAARQHIADRDHFRELADMYTDKNFKRKFLILAEKQS